MRETPLH